MDFVLSPTSSPSARDEATSVASREPTPSFSIARNTSPAGSKISSGFGRTRCIFRRWRWAIDRILSNVPSAGITVTSTLIPIDSIISPENKSENILPTCLAEMVLLCSFFTSTTIVCVFSSSIYKNILELNPTFFGIIAFSSSIVFSSNVVLSIPGSLASISVQQINAP